jgi:hypothetical protein
LSTLTLRRPDPRRGVPPDLLPPRVALPASRRKGSAGARRQTSSANGGSAAGIIPCPGGATISDQNPSAESPREDAAPQPAAAGKRTLGLIGLLVELLIPVVLSSALLLFIASKASWWNLHTPVGLGAFAVLLVLASLLVSVKVDGFTLARRERKGKRQLFNRAGARARLVKFVLGGLAIPIVAFVAANRIELSGHETPMTLVLKARLMQPAVTVAARIGAAVRRAGEVTVRVEGIRALQAMSSPEALDELLRVLAEDPNALRGDAESWALSKGLAAYDGQATPKLLELLGRLSPAERLHASAPPGGMFERDLAATFEALKDKIGSQTADATVKAARLARLEGAKADLEQLLAEAEQDAAPRQSASPLAGFVLDTFLAMSAKADDAVLAFARTTAADTGWSDAVRGQAMLLVAKLGGKDDLDRLCAFLDGPSALLRARAMQAIAVLQARLSATAGG